MLKRPAVYLTTALAAAATVVATATPVSAAPRNRITKVTATVYETGPCPEAQLWTAVKLVKRSGVDSLSLDVYAGDRYLGSRTKEVDVKPGATKVEFGTCVLYSVARKKNLKVTVGANSPRDYDWRAAKVKQSDDC